MDEMDFHGILLAVHSVLAWAMKVELDELIFFAMNLYSALSVGVDLYRMPAIAGFYSCGAWVFKWVLDELIFFAINLYSAFSVGVDLYWMAGIGHFQRLGAVIE